MTILGTFYSVTTSPVTHTVTVPTGVTADMRALFVMGTADNAFGVWRCRTSGSGVLFSRLNSLATNTMTAMFEGIGLVAGDTVSFFSNEINKPLSIHHIYRDEILGGAMIGFRSSFPASVNAVSGKALFAPGQKGLIVSLDRTFVPAGLVDAVVDTGETVTDLDWQHSPDSTNPSIGVYFGEFTANQPGLKQATVTLGSSSTNAWCGIMPLGIPISPATSLALQRRRPR